MSLRVSFAAATALSALLLGVSPVFAWTTTPAPLNTDGTPKYVDPEQQYQSEFTQPDQSGQSTAPDKAGSFHFSVTSQQGFGQQGFGQQGYGAQQGFFGSQGYGSPQGYSTANTPGSEFYNLGAPYQSHSNW
jgi:hypothetical protein